MRSSSSHKSVVTLLTRRGNRSFLQPNLFPLLTDPGIDVTEVEVHYASRETANENRAWEAL